MTGVDDVVLVVDRDDGTKVNPFRFRDLRSAKLKSIVKFIRHSLPRSISDVGAIGAVIGCDC